MKPNAVIRNVSVTTDAERKRKCLNIRQQAAPKTIPISRETIASEKNWPTITTGVMAVNLLPWS